MATVQFNAKFGKITLAGKNKVELELPESMEFYKIAEIASFKGHEIIVQFGNPQVEMLFQTTSTGLVATVNERGEVETVQHAVASNESQEDEIDSNDLADEELDFGPDEKTADEESTESSDESSNDDESAGTDAIDKGELEEFILDVRPAFTDIPFDFPGILERKRESGDSWMEIAKSLNQPSSRLQSSYNTYKKRVKKMIAEQTGGAA